MKRLMILVMFLGLGGCATGPEPAQQEMAYEVRTLLGYTIPEARAAMSLAPDPYDISISACHTMDGQLIPELNQLRMRLQQDYTNRATKQFTQQYNHRILYPMNGGR